MVEPYPENPTLYFSRYYKDCEVQLGLCDAEFYIDHITAEDLDDAIIKALRLSETLVYHLLKALLKDPDKYHIEAYFDDRFVECYFEEEDNNLCASEFRIFWYIYPKGKQLVKDYTGSMIFEEIIADEPVWSGCLDAYFEPSNNGLQGKYIVFCYPPNPPEQ